MTIETAEQVQQRLHIRPFSSSDLERCQEIAGSSFDWSHVVDLAASHLEVADMDGEVVGFAYIQIWAWNRVAWLGDILVDMRWRGKGVGTALLHRMIELARDKGCLTLMDHPPSDHPGVGFYLRQGFRVCGFNDRYLPEPENRTALFLGYDLAQP